MPRADQVAAHLPALYGAEERTTILWRVIQAFAEVMDDYDNALVDVMRAHWVQHAAELPDLARLGALFDIRPREQESLPAYALRLKSTIAAYLAGVGTVQVVKDLTAATFGVEKDSEPYRLIQVIDNPPRLAASEWRAVSYLSEWPVTVTGFESLDVDGNPLPIKPTIRIVGTANRTVNPILMNVTTETLVGYQGHVPDGKALVIRPDGTATLDGVDVTDRVYAQGVALFDRAVLDESHFSVEEKGTPRMPRGASVWRYLAPFAHFSPPPEEYGRFDQAMFAIPPAWRGVGFGAARFDASTFAGRIPARTAHFDWSRFNESVLAVPSARVQLEWREGRPATFVVRMPWSIIPAPEAGQDPRALVKGEVDRVRAAGVLAIVEYRAGEGVLIETQHQADALTTRLRMAGREAQHARDALALVSKVSLAAEEVQMADTFAFEGAFDEAVFDASIFAE